jgi:hypothetical protein
MQQTKGLRCHCCGHEQNVTVARFVLKVICPKCGAWVTLGEALGLSFGQAVFVTALALLIFG